MRQIPITTRLLVACSSLLCILFLFAANGGTASAKSLGSPPAGCQHILNANYSEVCVVPTVTTSPQSQCPGSNQYWQTEDSYNISVDETYTDVGNTCVTVTYNFSHSFNSCDISFYIPAGSVATATFNYTWHDAAGAHVGSIDEDSSVAGFKTLFNSSSATSLTFNDHDSPGSKNLSWGNTAKYSLEVFCS